MGWATTKEQESAANGSAAADSKCAVVGKSQRIHGAMSASEDVTVDGRVHGDIIVRLHALTIGATGFVDGEVQARAVYVEGRIVGDINADEVVVVGATGCVQGDVRSPRVVLREKAKFKGHVDTVRQSAGDAARAAPSAAAVAATPAVEPKATAPAALTLAGFKAGS